MLRIFRGRDRGIEKARINCISIAGPWQSDLLGGKGWAGDEIAGRGVLRERIDEEERCAFHEGIGGFGEEICRQ